MRTIRKHPRRARGKREALVLIVLLGLIAGNAGSGFEPSGVSVGAQLVGLCLAVRSIEGASAVSPEASGR